MYVNWWIFVSQCPFGQVSTYVFRLPLPNQLIVSLQHFEGRPKMWCRIDVVTLTFGRETSRRKIVLERRKINVLSPFAQCYSYRSRLHISWRRLRLSLLYNNFSALSILFSVITSTTDKHIARLVVYSLIWIRLCMVATEKFCHVDPSFSSSPCSSLSDLCTDIRKPCQSFSLIKATDSRLILSKFFVLN